VGLAEDDLMSFWCTLVMLAGPELPTEMRLTGKDPAEDFFVRLNAGVWGSHAMNFSAIRPDGTQAISQQQALASASVDLGVVSAGHWVFFGTIEGDYASGIRAEVVGASLGYRDYADPSAGPWIPHDATIYAGPVAGHLNITTPGFGNFQNSIGGRAGVDFTWRLGGGMGLGITAEYRYLQFKYEETIVSGDTRWGGGEYWVGAGLSFRF
jgi:hypothetical protein